mmetsp:Transcript_27307/g.68849  ORF Transcript_27307/g.68849 Transcript_27307/m.68849 type:complete len:252 (+) Transcript_27307:529-1284(+)
MVHQGRDGSAVDGAIRLVRLDGLDSGGIVQNRRLVSRSRNERHLIQRECDVGHVGLVVIPLMRALARVRIPAQHPAILRAGKDLPIQRPPQRTVHPGTVVHLQHLHRLLVRRRVKDLDRRRLLTPGVGQHSDPLVPGGNRHAPHPCPHFPLSQLLPSLHLPQARALVHGRCCQLVTPKADVDIHGGAAAPIVSSNALSVVTVPHANPPSPASSEQEVSVPVVLYACQRPVVALEKDGPHSVRLFLLRRCPR